MSTTTTDPIADMLARIRNALMVRKNVVSLPHSRNKEAIARILAENNYIDAVRVSDATVGKTLTLELFAEGTAVRISEINRKSTPGRRMYTAAREIPTVKRGRGMVIISTSKGIMTGTQAKEQHIGGELICEVY
jgi:small subunit ribosomal protein S8